MRPLHIVGGGLAGLALARALAVRGCAVRVSEAGLLPRHRVCGEFMAGLRPPTVSALGLGEALAPARPLRSTRWFLRGHAMHEAVLPETAPCVSRHHLDLAIAQAARAAGAVIETGVRETTDSAEGIILASGRRRGPARWLGLKLHVRDLELVSDLEVHLGHRSYVGLCRVESGAVNVCGLFRARPDLRAPKEAMLETYLRASGLTSLADRVARGTAVPDSACAIAGVSFGLEPHPTPSGPLPLGDALGMIPPFTGHGMAMALQSAELALPHVLAFAQGALPWSEAQAAATHALRGAFRARMRAATSVHPVLLHAPGQRLLAWLARGRLLPFASLYWLTHGGPPSPAPALAPS